MPSVVVHDDWLPRPQLEAVHALVEAHYAARYDGAREPEFSWYAPKRGHHVCRSIPAALREVAEVYVENLVARLEPWIGNAHVIEGYEWWSNHGNALGWHWDKDETLFRSEKRLCHPVWSTILYTDVAIDGPGGELILLPADAGPPPYNHELTSAEIPHKHHAITPRTNRLVVFERGMLHRIDPFQGRRASLAMNLWTTMPLEFESWQDSVFCHPVT